MKPPFILWLLIVFLVILAFGGLAGAYGFLSDPSGEFMGMAAQLPQLHIPNYILPGLFLLVAMFLAPLVLTYGLLARPHWAWAGPLVRWSGAHWAWAGSLVLGLGLALWLVIQAALIGFAWPIQWLTAFIDFVILATTLAPPVRSFYRNS
jgi:preprotein translocase subunit SecG